MQYPKKRLTVLLSLCLVQAVSAQNLVPDSSFEKNQAMPLNFSAIGNSYTWRKPSMGTTDLFCKCSRRQAKYSLVNVPANLMGNQAAHSGTCYAGFFAHSHGDYCEYLQTALVRYLEEGKYYRIQVYISLADYSRAAVDQIGACLLPYQVKYKSTDVIEGLDPVYLKIAAADRMDTSKWQRLSVVYQAKGGEGFLLIGRFGISQLLHTKVKAPPGVKARINQVTERDAYYYIDDVSVTELPPGEWRPQEIKKQEEPDDVISMASAISYDFGPRLVFFGSNSTVITETERPMLDSLVLQLQQHTALKLEIEGHADNSGNEKLNYRLSENRCAAVINYLVMAGIAASRLTSRANGSSVPAADNDNPTGRQRNRRVEIRAL